jgi:hypothetical protein
MVGEVMASSANRYELSDCNAQPCENYSLARPGSFSACDVFRHPAGFLERNDRQRRRRSRACPICSSKVAQTARASSAKPCVHAGGDE